MHLIGYNSGYLTSFREQLFPPYGSHTSCLKKKRKKRKKKRRRRSRVITDVLFCERVVKGLLVIQQLQYNYITLKSIVILLFCKVMLVYSTAVLVVAVVPAVAA